MARALWSGSVSFGLVNVPVKLHTATEEKDISFHQLHGRSGTRIRNKRVREDTGREVAFEDIVSGYEVSPGEYVVVTPEELESVDPGPRRTIDIEHFVTLDEIDPICFARSYYVAPARDDANHAYALLRECMRKAGRVAIGRFVLRTKQHLVALRPMDQVLVLTTLYFADEVRDPGGLALPERVRLSGREADIALRLVDSMTTTWKPERYADTYREQVLKLVKDKAKGRKIVVEEETRPAPVTDLLAALEASMKEARGRSSGHRRRSKRPTHAKSA